VVDVGLATDQEVRISGGVRVNVVESGEPEAELTVLLLHGWTLDHTTWSAVAQALPAACDRPVRVLRHDHRGHGWSAPAPNGSATIERIADDVAELLEQRAPTGPVVLAGHSMGGMTIMALAERHPGLFAERVAGVALVATSSGGLSRLTFGLPRPLAGLVLAGETAANRGLVRLGRSRLAGWPAALEPFLRWLLFGPRAPRSQVAHAAEQVARCHPASMVGFRASLNEHERREALTALRGLPVVILAGGADRLCPLPHSRVIAEELPEAELIVYPGAGHMVPVERAHEVTAWIARLVRAGGAGEAEPTTGPGAGNREAAEKEEAR
jgi:pimeloyl-ACP methyl ester carboxylesterase